ncbi:MAG: SCP2 sterol-binding domain-containing protein [Deltaproteobacteria bacterium]|nr:SCP2 sterol-binding domain-containing protein [Deltaproteobacteria bacterium]
MNGGVFEKGELKNRLQTALSFMLKTGASIPLRVMPLWLEAIGAGIFMALQLDKRPGLRERLAEIDGKVFLFDAKDIKKRFYLHIKDGDILLIPHIAVAPDVTMTGAFDVLFELLLGSVDPDTVFFSRRLEITGDTAAAVHFKNILAAG